MQTPSMASSYLAEDYSEPYPGEINREGLKLRRKEQALLLDKSSTRVYQNPIELIQDRQDDPMDFDGDTVRFGEEGLLDSFQSEQLLTALKSLIPWRKGPFSYYGVDIDSEWQSHLKWNRVLPWLPDLKNKKICDIGCNNEYYMYRMLSQEPWFVLGIDPMVRYYFHHLLNRKFYRDPKLHFDLLGVDDMNLFPGFFDVVFLMGIIYHRRNPVQTLNLINASMRSGGTLILESSGIPGDDPYCLFPDGRYMKAPGYWFLPTASALKNMLSRTGFHKIEMFENFKLDVNEQRQTDWAIYESLEHFLDADDPGKTVEGYPAPVRIYIRAEKR
ncbi:tRNA 5-methoxyuridine(34)/uridine 5-oxyacetic acid(34) synthase CmoB [Oceanispirochaeta crateris]|uniref:tRNA 5-methoxyuridine(34)/uridine 5-oxyacetic acid(34) synthase CmoB n=1 Tax=Oceanispirochaeta crateris TaxID=2518645 RepID=A0A5C1QLH2_9SPIO|nr:tRNA 5-methoxyuridine(34)/uridine 5-oxyacetic acid(34) synthase CmoB [Oceanispirochaeta crateris]QEN07810.1 tRNA 5-methoxyuridine(34)/uridine 5-oxyacetic acid(34) synthase CmoB [Oceanispirochaeta crateris]